MEATKMKPTYKIFILDEDEFNGLHKYIPEVSKEDLKEGLGFANPKTREAYIKRTGVKEWDDETIIHEAEELLAKNSSDEDQNNIRWKKGGVARFIVPALLSLIPGVGPVLAAASSVGMGQYAQSQHPEELGKPGVLSGIMQAASGYLGGKALAGGISGGIAGGTQAAPGFLSKAGGIVSGLGKGALTGSAGINTNILGMTSANLATPALEVPKVGMTSAFPSLQSQVGSAMGLSTLGSTLPAAASLGVSALPAILGNVSKVGTTPTIPSMSQLAPSATSTVAPTAGQVVPSTPIAPAGKTLLEQAKELVNLPNILGAGSLMASTVGKTPQFEMPSQFTELQNKLMSGQALSPLGQQAQTELSNILKSTPSELYPTANDEYYNAALRRTRESYAEATKQLDAAYNVAGVYGSGEHLQAKADLQEELARTESAMAAEIEQRRFEMGVNAKYQAVQQALGVDQNVMNDLLGLSGLSVQTAAAMYNANVADVEEIRKALGTLGSELLIRGTTGQGMKGTTGININLGQ